MALRSLALALSLLLPTVALAAPKPTSLPSRPRAPLPTAPAPAKAKPSSSSSSSSSKALTRMKPGSTIRLDGGPLKLAARPNPAALNLALTALRRFADDVNGRNPVDRAVARSLKGTPRARKIARRILARIDAQPPELRRAKLGAPSNDPVTAAALRNAAIRPLTNGVGFVRTDTLPAMSPTAPSSYRLALSGVRTVETAEGDGDELLVTLVRAGWAGAHFETEISDIPLGGLQAGLRTLDETVLEGHGLERIVASIALEVDGDEAAVREEVRVMIGLASALAKQLVTTSDDSIERLERFAFALDYSIGLLAVSDPGRWPNGALQKTVLGGTTSLKNLYFTPPAADEGASWKLLHDHDMASGHYKIYFDVPASIPPQPNVILDVKRVEALDPESNGADMRVTVGIGFSAEATRTLARNKNVHEPRWSVQRKVNRAVEAFIRVEELVEGPAWGEVELANGTYEPCGESHPSGSYPPCPGTWQHLATDPSGSGSVDLWIDVESGAISGDVNGQAGKSLTVQGLHGARARVTFVPRVVTP